MNANQPLLTGWPLAVVICVAIICFTWFCIKGLEGNDPDA